MVVWEKSDEATGPDDYGGVSLKSLLTTFNEFYPFWETSCGFAGRVWRAGGPRRLQPGWSETAFNDFYIVLPVLRNVGWFHGACLTGRRISPATTGLV